MTDARRLLRELNRDIVDRAVAYEALARVTGHPFTRDTYVDRAEELRKYAGRLAAVLPLLDQQPSENPHKVCLDCGTEEWPGPAFCPKCQGPMKWAPKD